jgi:hypothetical protein
MNSNKPTSKELKKQISTIQNIIKNIQMKGITEEKKMENYFWDNHPDIMDKYPFLVTHLCSGENIEMLEVMLKQLEIVEKGIMTEAEANLEIGKKLGDKYLPN